MKIYHTIEPRRHKFYKGIYTTIENNKVKEIKPRYEHKKPTIKKSSLCRIISDALAAYAAQVPVAN